MPPVLRFGVFVIAIATAFAGGYFIRQAPLKTVAAEPAAGPDLGPRPPKSASQTTVLTTRTVPATFVARAGQPRPTAAQTFAAPASTGPDLPPPGPKADPPTILLPPVAVHEPPKPEPVDPNDPAFQMIKNELGIKTTVLDKSAPQPVVLADAKKDLDPTIPPPIPMTGPTPKLEMAPTITVGPVPPAAKPVPLLNSRAVELDFEVTRAGLSKIKAVELWTTRDGGATWKQTDRMEGCRPPFRTRLGSEGEYGFRLVFESESGMRTSEPKPGQLSDLVMELDMTPPEVRIAAHGPGQPGTVLLRWRAIDKHLDRDPSATRLEYSVDGQTWQPIELTARPADPGGSNYHEWLLPPGVPSKVLLRVTVRDKAGNVGTAVTSEKMSVDLVAPEGRLTGVRPQGQGPEPGPMPRDVEAGAADGPIPAVLRSVLPALLNSPGFGPLPGLQHASELSPSKELSAQDYHEWWCRQYEAKLRSLVRAESAKAWVEQLTNTTVAEESPRPMFRRPEPGAVPPIPEMLPDEAERLLAQLHGRVRTLDPAEPGAERGPDLGWTQVPQEGWFRPYERTLLRREWQRTAEATFRTLTRGETVLRLLTDHDWQPSTAKRQRYRWSGPTFADRPFSGTFDAGPGFSGTLPGGGVRLDF